MNNEKKKKKKKKELLNEMKSLEVINRGSFAYTGIMFAETM